jgi:hypothetical protein
VRLLGRGICELGLGCEPGHRSDASNRATLHNPDVEGTVRQIVLLIAAMALFLCSVDAWAGGSRTAATDDAPVFVISNAL